MSTPNRSIRRHTARAPATAILLGVAFLIGACTPGSATPSPAVTSAAVPSSGPVAVAPTPTSSLGPASTPDPPPTLTTSPTSPTAPATAPPAVAEADPDPFEMNLYRKGDFVGQYTFEWCVGACLQMALNLSTDASHTSRADQQRLWEMARDRSDSPFGGANPRGWTASLNDLGVGPYRLASFPTLESAVDAAAAAIRATDRPVGLVMWRGRHAWVMSGFEASADPARFDDVEVTGIRVQDPLYPHGSSVWGASPKPNSLLTPAQLAKQFVIRDRGRTNLGVPPGWLLILPVTTEA